MTWRATFLVLPGHVLWEEGATPHRRAAPPEQFLEPALGSQRDWRGGAAPVRLVLPGKDKGHAAPLGSTRAPGQGPTCTGADLVLTSGDLELPYLTSIGPLRNLEFQIENKNSKKDTV